MNKSIFLLLAIAALLFVGCTSNNETNALENSKEAEVTQGENNENKEVVTEHTPETKTITFMLDTKEKSIEIPYEASRIVVIGYGLIDIVESLGHKDRIVGVPDPKNPMFPTFLTEYEHVTSVGGLRGDDLEAIAGLQPDLILAGARTLGAFEDLTEIAPTVYFSIPGMNSTGYVDKMSQNIEDVAYILNEEATGKQAIDVLKHKIAVVNETVKTIDGINSMFLIVTGKTVNVYTDNVESRYGFVYNEFGFKAIANVEEIADEDLKVNEGEASRHGNSISFEFISAKNPDFLIVLDRGAATAQEGAPASDTLDNPLISETNAFKNDNIIYLDGAAWYLATGGIQATDIMLNDILESLDK